MYFTKALKTAREARGITQSEMVDLLTVELGKSIAVVTYQKWEQGILNVKPDDVLTLSRLLKLHIPSLVERR